MSEAGREQYPLRCAWCPGDTPADHMAVIDIDGIWARRETVLLCGQDAHSVTGLPENWERWWLFRLTSDGASDAGECAPAAVRSADQ